MPGALDVSIGTRIGKKGRPVTDFRVLVQPAARDARRRACFDETATLGLRCATSSAGSAATREVPPTSTARRCG